MMKRLIAACLVMLTCLSAGAEAADVIVLLDTSESMFSYFEPVKDYLIGSVVRDYIRAGDTLHILTFADTAQLELSQEIKAESDIRAVVARLYLLYAFGIHTDLAGAFDYLDQYVTDLPGTGLKNIIIITDAIHNPPSTSHYLGKPQAEIEASIAEAVSSMKSKGWRVSFIKVPMVEQAPGSGISEEGDALDLSGILSEKVGPSATEFDAQNPLAMTETAMALPSVVFPEDLGKRDARFNIPVKVNNSTAAEVRLELVGCVATEPDLGDILADRAFLKLGKGKSGILRIPVRLPDSVAEGPLSLRIKLEFAGAARVTPGSGIVSLTLSRNAFMATMRSIAPILLFVLIVLAVIAIVIVIALIVRHSPQRREARERYRRLMAGEAKDAGMQPHARGEVAAQVAASGTGGVSSTGSIEKTPIPGLGTAQTHAVPAKKGMPGEKPYIMERGPVPSAIEAQASQAAVAGQTGKTAPTGSIGAAGVTQDQEAIRAQALSAARQAAREEEAEAERMWALEEAADAEGLRKAESAIDAMTIRKEGRLRVEFRINEQNPLIGFRNIRNLRPGMRLSLGGLKTSDFLVFVVRVPPRLARLYFDGERLAFVPVRKEYFPDLDGMLEDCLGKPIRCVTPRGFSMTMTFSRYEDPAERLNRMNSLIDLKGSRGFITQGDSLKEPKA
jgi:hypothetical protein